MLRLVPIPVADLTVLAQSGMPPARAMLALAEAMPPACVAQRALAQINLGKPPCWCLPFYMVRCADGAVVGSCGFKDMPDKGRVEIGYGVAPASRNLGMARAAVADLLQRAFSGEEACSVLAQVSVDNLPSQRVVQALGFLPSGRQLDHHGDMLVQWVCRREVWRGDRRSAGAD